MKMNKVAIYAPVLVVSGLILYTLQKANNTFETFQNYPLENFTSSNNNSNNNNGFDNDSSDAAFLFLKDSFPVTDDPNKLTNNQYNNIWMEKPVFPVGSYQQITNNIRYNKSPDNGSIIPSEFSGAFYETITPRKSKPIKRPPIYNRRRVNYYLSH